MSSPSNGSRNRLLAALLHADRELLTPALEPIVLDVRHVLEVPNVRSLTSISSKAAWSPS
jgi:hypothetical protein